MSDFTQKTEEIALIIPEETQQKFPELVEWIKQSRSMDNKERNYWLQVLPLMTEDQVAELRDILTTEKKKLAEIEEKYSLKNRQGEGIQKIQKTEEELQEEEEKKRKIREQQQKKEYLARQEENVDDILSQLDFA